jgi:peptidoglycan/LPS O-acetylase OafA/YrhL
MRLRATDADNLVMAARETGSQAGSFLAPLESLRGIAAWSIVLFHVWSARYAVSVAWNLGPATVFMQPLQAGVTLFFVLSGFLLYRPFARAALSGAAYPSLRRYARNRALRILPAYWVVLLAAIATRATAAVVRSAGTQVGHLTWSQSVWNMLLLQNYRPTMLMTGISHTWSLVVEVSFYICLPAVALLGRRSVWWPPAVFIAGGLLGKLVLLLLIGENGVRFSDPTWNATLAHSLASHADLFGFGMAAGVVFTRWERDGEPAWINGGVVGRLIAYVGVPATVLGFYFIPRYLWDSIVAFFCALLILRSATTNSRCKFLRSSFARANGRFSYSVFLWNYPVLAFLTIHGMLLAGHGALAFLGNTAIAVAAVTLLSATSYRFVEAPAMRLKRIRGGRFKPAAAEAV